MARKSRKSSNASSDDDNDVLDDLPDDGDDDGDEVDYEADARAGGIKARDWRDVERYKEMRELRQLVDDDFDFDDL